jgi:hypothetical protein
MSDSLQNASSESSNSPPTDESGATVNVVDRGLRDQDEKQKKVDKVITPSSTKVKEQDAELINQKAAEVERKLVDDGK